MPSKTTITSQDFGLQCQTSIRLKFVVKSIWALFEPKKLFETKIFENLNLFHLNLRVKMLHIASLMFTQVIPDVQSHLVSIQESRMSSKHPLRVLSSTTSRDLEHCTELLWCLRRPCVMFNVNLSIFGNQECPSRLLEGCSIYCSRPVHSRKCFYVYLGNFLHLQSPWFYSEINVLKDSLECSGDT